MNKLGNFIRGFRLNLPWECRWDELIEDIACGVEKEWVKLKEIHRNRPVLPKKENRYGEHNKWLRKNKYPGGYQVLCFNCNIQKYHSRG